MVTIALSTVSVIASIIVVRLNSGCTYPVPRVVRVIAFRCMARVLCVRTSQTTDVPDEISCDQTPATNANNHVELTSYIVCARGNNTHHDGIQTSTEKSCCCQLKPQVDNVLGELRKVTMSTYMRLLRQYCTQVRYIIIVIIIIIIKHL